MNISVNEDQAWHALVRLQGEFAAESGDLGQAHCLFWRGGSSISRRRPIFAISTVSGKF